MGLADIISAEDRVSVKFSDFYTLVKGCAERAEVQNPPCTHSGNAR